MVRGKLLPLFRRSSIPWTGIDSPISEEELRVLGPGDFLRRDYKNQKHGRAEHRFIHRVFSQPTHR